MKKLTTTILAIAIIATLAVWTDVFASEQFPDIIKHRGKNYNLMVFPMEYYFQKTSQKQQQWRNSALVRGYRATFEIIRNELWVIDMEDIQDVDRGTVIWKSIIRNRLNGKSRMKLDWFTGVLILPNGKMVEYVNMNYQTYEHYILIKIENGNYIRELDITFERYNEYQKAQYEAYRKTDAYKKEFKKKLEHWENEEHIERFIEMSFRSDQKANFARLFNESNE